MEAIYGINYDGVKKRPTFEELIDYKEPKITYPDRSALFTRESPLMTQFDNIGAMELEDQQRREMRERMREDMLRHIASSSQFTMQELRSMSPQIFRMDIDDDTRTPMTFPINTRFDAAYISLDEEVTKRISDDVDKQNTAIALAQAELYATHGGSRSSQLMQRAGEIFERLPQKDDAESESDKDVSGAAASSSKSDKDVSGAAASSSKSDKDVSGAAASSSIPVVAEESQKGQSKTLITDKDLGIIGAAAYNKDNSESLLNVYNLNIIQIIAKRRGFTIDRVNRAGNTVLKTKAQLIKEILAYDKAETT